MMAIRTWSSRPSGTSWPGTSRSCSRRSPLGRGPLDGAGRAGLTGVGLPEECGGSGGELADAVAVVAPWPPAPRRCRSPSTCWSPARRWSRPALDLPPVEQPLSFALADAVTADASDDGDGPGRFLLTGTATDVAWAGVARTWPS